MLGGGGANDWLTNELMKELRKEVIRELISELISELMNLAGDGQQQAAGGRHIIGVGHSRRPPTHVDGETACSASAAPPGGARGAAREKGAVMAVQGNVEDAGK